jgi:hypothetical protein
MSSITSHWPCPKVLPDTDLLQAQSIPYRRMSANLYATATPGEYYHIHGSLEASTTLRFLGLEPFRPDLETHEQIVPVIESAVKKHTVDQLEELNAHYRQAGVKAYKHDEFLQTPHVRSNQLLLPLTRMKRGEHAHPIYRDKLTVKSPHGL